MSKKQSTATREAGRQRAAERAAAIRAEQERKERRSRNLMVTGAIVGVLVLVLAIVVAVQAGRDSTGQAATAPAGAVDGYAVPMGPDDAPVTVTVYEDMLCPYCGMYERATSERLKEYAESGDVQVRYFIVSFLDDRSQDRYSTRAANAVAATLDTAGPDAAVELHDRLFESQPAEGGSGPTDDELVDLAVQTGADEAAVRPLIEDLAFEQWIENATGEWSKRGFTSTPTVTVDGEVLEIGDPATHLADTEAAIERSLGDK